MIDDTITQRLSKSVLHDIIKSVINYYPLQIQEICRKIPETKKSNILNKNHWIFNESRQEQININWKQADAVWFYLDKDMNTFFVVHEIKTGFFDIADIQRKYHTGMNIQIWVWAFKSKMPKTKHPITMKILPIDAITPFVNLISDDAIKYLNRDAVI